ncbi:glycoside hydrolase family 35 protein [Mycena galericulata]|nr:glycoside hydrolase family 35 protein [Mycena galericulata]
MLLPKVFAFFLCTLAVPREQRLDGLQNMVTWDEYSLFINGSRVNVFSGEVHPYRYGSILHCLGAEKVKSLGFNTISAYFFWGIHEPKRGEISFEGFRDLQPFFDAAMEAGLYVIARPGPYINAETTGGGFPGWGTYTPGLWRTSNTTYVEAYTGYMKAIGEQIAANQITNGGPVILVQVENEYSGFQPPYTEDFTYESELKSIMRASGVNIPLTVNDAWPGGHFVDVDIYGYDSYPNGFDCAAPDVWLSSAVDSTEYFWGAHLQYSPQSPNAVFEFQGGAFDPWGGAGYEDCAQLLGPEFERVFYKNEFAMSTTMINFYMIFGGTNWGGIAHPGVYTSYDYGSAIAEDRTLREKYYELKLQANFRAVSPAFLTSRPINIFATQGSFTGNQALKTTQVLDAVGNKTGFYIVRQTDASTTDVQTYTLTLPTSIGNLTIPTIGGSLALTGKDSKIHVVDYAAGSTTLLYSTGEILTWATIDDRDVILCQAATVVSGTGTIKTKNLAGNSLALQYTTTGQTVVQIGNTLLYILGMPSRTAFWILHPPSSGAFAQFSTHNPIIVKGGPVSFEIIAPAAFQQATFNGGKLSLSKTRYGTLTTQKTATLPAVTLPNLAKLQWPTRSRRSSRNIQDALWTVANHTTTVNPNPHNTSVVLFAGDYGFHTGNILWRAHFTATGAEQGFAADVQGGSAFAYSVWLDETFVGSWAGDPNFSDFNGTFPFPAALQGSFIFTTFLSQIIWGTKRTGRLPATGFKIPRGILSYHFMGSNATTVGVWKIAGNLGGEDYADTTRGPLNEGGLFAERQGWHLPGFDDSTWASDAPTTGIAHAGVGFYRTTFDLDVPAGVDYPLSLVIGNSTTNPNFRSKIYVNGYQFGKYVNNIGPQSAFPVPQGILNYNGANTLAVSLWAADCGRGATGLAESTADGADREQHACSGQSAGNTVGSKARSILILSSTFHSQNILYLLFLGPTSIITLDAYICRAVVLK